jgi:transcriptional regulator with XRE-family HTH domain
MLCPSEIEGCKHRMAAISGREAFGRAVRAARVELGLSQEALAEVAGVQRPTLSAIECGTSDARLQTVFRLAVALGVPASELVGRAEQIISKS